MISFVVQHIRVGYKNYLIVIDLILIFLIASELLIKFSISNISALVFSQTSLFIIEAWIILAFLLLVLPIIASISRILIGPKGIFVKPFFGTRNRYTSVLHFFLAIIVAYAIVLCYSHETISGYTLELETYEKKALSVSYVYAIVEFVKGIIIVFGSLEALGILVTIIVGSTNRVFMNYRIMADLVDLKSIYYPGPNRHTMNFNSGAFFPRIKFITKSRRKYLNRYNSYTSTSNRAKQVLSNLSEETKSKFRAFLINSGFISKNNINIVYYPGTTRTLEVLLNSYKQTFEVILSPYEHPTIIRLIERYKGCDTINKYHIIRKNEDFFNKSINDQIIDLSNEIEITYTDKCKFKLLIISQVFYATGDIIKLSNLQSKINKSIQIIVDGSHALGNLEEPGLNFNFEAYFTSAHKWLCSPFPLGILIYRKDGLLHFSEDLLETYDSWGTNKLPLTTSDISPLAHFMGSIDLLSKLTFEEVNSRIQLQKQRFKELFNDRFEFVTKSECIDLTNMLAIKPKQNFTWKEPEKLKQNLEDVGIDIEVIECYNVKKPWVRISLAYFLEIRNIEALHDQLVKMSQMIP